MMRPRFTLALLTAVVSSSLAASALALKFDAQAGWVTKATTSSMRVAEFELPKVTGDAEDASVIVYFFGSQAGTVQANIDRWISQMTQPDGKDSKDVAQTSRLTSRGLNVTLFDLSGTYVAEMTPGSAQRFNKPNFRLRAAVVETPSGPYFVKAVGPSKTMAKWDASITTFVKSIRIE